MKNISYICIGKQLVGVTRHTIIPHIAYPLVFTGNSVSCLPKHIKGGTLSFCTNA